MRRRVVAWLLLTLLGGATACGTIAGTASPLAGQTAGIAGAGGASFVGTTAATVVMIAWTNDGRGHLTGSLQYAQTNTNYVQGTNGQPVTSQNAAFTGSASNGSVSLHVELGSTLNGIIDGTTLTIEWPQTDGTIAPFAMRVGSVSDYDDAVHTLTSQLEGERAVRESQQQAAQHAQQQSQATGQLSDDMAKIRTDEAALAKAVAAVSGAEAKVAAKSTAADNKLSAEKAYSGPKADCYQLATMDYDTNSAVYDLNSAVYDLTSAIGDVHQAVSNLADEVGQARQDEQAARDLGGTVPSDTDGQLKSASDAAANGTTTETQAQKSSDDATEHGQDVSTAGGAVTNNCDMSGS